MRQSSLTLPDRPKSWALTALVTLAISSLALLSGCNSAKVDNTWKSADVQTLSFKRVLIVATVADGPRRRAVEDTVRSAVKNAEVVPSHTIVADVNELKSVENLEAAARKIGADGIVVMRPVADRTELKYTPGNVYPDAYASLRDYWGPAYATMPLYSDEGRRLAYTNRFIMIETNIYEASNGKLLWSGTTELVNPGSIENLVQETVAALHKELRRQRLVP
ncbi:hypothetical protein Ga0100231_005900 [Opitutaceae bacterium TAV4]|nr:hypothetical protein Ga0100231_014095 [Opitutaceae bacterium TAV4]RRJ98279.1 hypothetical protein Ga0100231_005900 [Opitutaceae bacterium TAV4]RRK02860.1 hypothetical protein Ga0100230_005110 [Opitutaceae bacterium TAV3]